MESEKSQDAGRVDIEAAQPNTDVHQHVAADQDVAIAMVGEQKHAIDPTVVARAVRKIDLFLIPAMIFGCTLRPG
jgi:hypothetical protein